MKTIPSSNQTTNNQIFNLFSSIVALTGSIVVLVFFIDINITNWSKIHLAIKLGYSSLVWGIFSISSMLYYFIRSKGTTTSGGYIHPLFGGLLKVIQILPVFGLIFSLINGTRFITESQTWNTIINSSSDFLDSVLILFILAYFGAGLSGIKRFFKNKT